MVAVTVRSNEIRENSFLTNVEVGTLTVETAEVAFWRDFFSLFCATASPVTEALARVNQP